MYLKYKKLKYSMQKMVPCDCYTIIYHISRLLLLMCKRVRHILLLWLVEVELIFIMD